MNLGAFFCGAQVSSTLWWVFIERQVIGAKAPLGDGVGGDAAIQWCSLVVLGVVDLRRRHSSVWDQTEKSRRLAPCRTRWSIT